MGEHAGPCLSDGTGFARWLRTHGHIQGPPAALRELAAALVEAADRADAADRPAPAPGLVEGVAG